MMAAIIVILLASLVAGSIESNLMEVFRDPNWIDKRMGIMKARVIATGNIVL